ncbi:kelch domain-containing protein 10 homolog isoform X2 [Aethina tumida]|uniref:kelch domain-containing protein 10 homolog isoform X2 n=1 Tax=Aethina tumida TaxID=116153 RepID=UPI00096B2E0F|nr:kelch domain-containing protein 10 homolog isoform X2 [Aethina tumida]
MYSKCLTGLLKKLFHLLMVLVKMYGSGSSVDSSDAGYSFRSFKFEEIVPSQKKHVPHPRSGHRIGADSSNFYSFGGYNPTITNSDNLDAEDDGFLVWSYPLFQELWKFNYASRQWTKFKISETLPLELASNALLLHKNYLMVYGGTGSPFGFRCSNQLYVCRVTEENDPMVEIQTSGQLPLPLYGQALVHHNDYLYTIGGTTGLSYSCNIHRLNMKTTTWEIVYICSGKGDYEPEGRYRHEVSFDGKQIYVLGGGTADLAYDLQYVPAFNLEKKIWNKLSTFRDRNKGYPAPRRCHGAVQIDTDTGVQVFITGGHDGENVFNDLWKLDLKTMQWTCFDFCQLPISTYFHDAAVSPEGKLYVFGGINSIDDEVVRSNTIYSTWLCIPKLSEMCWEAVLHYSPHIVNCKSDDLINIGLPRHFVQRLGKK